MADSEVDLMNAQMVGARSGLVTVAFPAPVMEPEQALVHAAWLVAVASNLDPTLPPFGEVLTAVQNT